MPYIPSQSSYDKGLSSRLPVWIILLENIECISTQKHFHVVAGKFEKL